MADLQILVDDMDTDRLGLSTITGEVFNVSKHSFAYVSVEYNIYDAEGMQIASTMANINNLEPNGTWSFKTLPTKRGASYKFMGFKAF